MAKFLLLVDTPSIKKFVFGTDKLAEIAGASGLLDHLNRTRTPELLKQSLSLDTIYCNGGKGLFVVEAEAAQLRSAIEELQAMYRKQTQGGAQVLCSYVPYSGDAGYQEALHQVHLGLEESRLQRNTTVAAVHTAFMKECESCGQNPAEVSDKDQWLCRVCDNKRRVYSEKQIQRIWRELRDALRAEQILDEARWYDLRPRDFEEIGGRSNRIGLVYADGNAMGKILRELDSRAVTKLFSETVDSAIRDACYHTLSSLCYEDKKLYGDILLLGGDDLVVVVPAETAIQFALEVAKQFQELTRDKIEAACQKDSAVAQFFSGDRKIVRQSGLTIGLGVVIGKARQPFHMLLEQAEELLALAKREASKQSKNAYHTPTYIDFHDATQSVFSDVEQIRQHYWMKTKVGKTRWRLTMKPYNTDNLGKLLQHAESLQASGWPSSKLQELRSACFETPRVLYHTLISLLSRVKPDQHKALVEALAEFHHTELLSFFLPQQATKQQDGEQELMLVDLLELASYLAKETE